MLKEIPIEDILPPKVLLRPVRADSIDYLELTESIKAVGLLNSICVRPREKKYEIIEGMWRFSVAKKLCLESMPAIIKEGLSDEEVLAIQISANAIRPETKPCEFAAQLLRISKEVPGMTLPKLASMVNKSPFWIREQLCLLKLDVPIRLVVDRGEITVSNAYKLARAPLYLQNKLVEAAKVLAAEDFAALVHEAKKQAIEEIQKGRREQKNFEVFVPTAHLRKPKTILAELEVCEDAAIQLAITNSKTPMDGWKAALNWVLHLDSLSLKQQKIEHDYRDRKTQKELQELDIIEGTLFHDD